MWCSAWKPRVLTFMSLPLDRLLCKPGTCWNLSIYIPRMLLGFVCWSIKLFVRFLHTFLSSFCCNARHIVLLWDVLGLCVLGRWVCWSNGSIWQYKFQDPRISSRTWLISRLWYSLNLLVVLMLWWSVYEFWLVISALIQHVILYLHFASKTFK